MSNPDNPDHPHPAERALLDAVELRLANRPSDQAAVARADGRGV